MSTRTRLARLQRLARAALGELRLPGGGSHFFDPRETSIALWRYGSERMLEDYREMHGEPSERPPDPPEVLRVIGGLPTRAAREEALQALYRVDKPLCPFDVEELLESGRIVPKSFRVEVEES